MNAKSIDDASPDDWDVVSKHWTDTIRGEYVKAIDESIIEEEASSNGVTTTDTVHNPAHYNQGGIEAIAYIKQQVGEGFVSYCEGNVHKYIHRYRYKNGVEDLKKARWYLDKMIEELQ